MKTYSGRECARCGAKLDTAHGVYATARVQLSRPRDEERDGWCMSKRVSSTVGGMRLCEGCAEGAVRALERYCSEEA